MRFPAFFIFFIWFLIPLWIFHFYLFLFRVTYIQGKKNISRRCYFLIQLQIFIPFLRIEMFIGNMKISTFFKNPSERRSSSSPSEKRGSFKCVELVIAGDWTSNLFITRREGSTDSAIQLWSRSTKLYQMSFIFN